MTHNFTLKGSQIDHVFADVFITNFQVNLAPVSREILYNVSDDFSKLE